MPFFTSFSGKILSAPGLKLGPKIFQFIKTFTSNVQEYSLSSDLVANGWDEVTPVQAIITVNSGIYVWSDNISVPAFNTGYIAPGSTISIINNGYIIGRGGDGANSVVSNTYNVTPPAAQAGGNAINLNYPVSITNYSYIAGGGGGGRGGYSAGGGGAGGGTGGTAIVGSVSIAGGAGGAPGSAGSNGSNLNPPSGIRKGSGGGGGRIIIGAGGNGGSGMFASTMYGSGGQEGGGGGGGIAGDPYDGGGSSYGGGGGGHGGGLGGSGISGVTGRDGTGTAGGRGWGDPYDNGGGGGGPWGGSGGASDSNSNSFAGAAGGKAVNLNGNTVTWIATGTRYGAIS